MGKGGKCYGKKESRAKVGGGGSEVPRAVLVGCLKF